ncbi:MAG: hypothetical protein IPM99_16630 [Rubrivivax sp.]|nr:hypothetical protein [Rubrivivax sp.]
MLDFGIARLGTAPPCPRCRGAVQGRRATRAEQLTGSAIDCAHRPLLARRGDVRAADRRRAFEGRSLAEINRAVLDSDPPPAHEADRAVPREVSAIVARLMGATRRGAYLRQRAGRRSAGAGCRRSSCPPKP